MCRYEEITEAEMFLLNGGEASNWFYDAGRAVGHAAEKVVDCVENVRDAIVENKDAIVTGAKIGFEISTGIPVTKF